MSRIHPRSKLLRWLFIAATVIILLQLFYLQVIDQSFHSKANATAIARRSVSASRGLILDRNSQLLLDNEPVYDLMVNYSLLNKRKDYTRLYQILNLNHQTFWESTERDWASIHFARNKPFVFYRNLSDAQYYLIQELLYDFPAFFFQERSKRVYKHSLAPHLLGYLNEVSNETLRENSEIYNPGDQLGASGVEKQYETFLRGEKGVKYELRNKYGRTVASYKSGAMDRAAKSGDDLLLTIDADLQRLAEKLLLGKRGSIVALNPNNGEVLCMASSPRYDPEILQDEDRRRNEYPSFLNDPNKPLFDRAISAEYPPGSIFKPLVALVALQLGVTKERRYIPCNGMYYYNGVPFKCHKHPKTYDIQTAMAFSCNTYFRLLLRDIVDMEGFDLPERGLDTLGYYCSRFGIGRRTGIDLPSERPGNIPSPDYYDRMYPKSEGGWKSPTIMSIGIGQGEVEMTTLQMAHLCSILANRGSCYAPHILKGLKNRYYQIDQQYSIKKTLPIEPEYFKPVIEGMIDVVEYGTGKGAFIEGIQFCGKTGTSQNPHGDDHSVFIGFGPVQNPQIAIAVIVENAGAGNDVAAPITGLIAEKYLKDSIPQNRKWLVNRLTRAHLTKS
jgi:penicillin-binding protein 2